MTLKKFTVRSNAEEIEAPAGKPAHAIVVPAPCDIAPNTKSDLTIMSGYP